MESASRRQGTVGGARIMLLIIACLIAAAAAAPATYDQRQDGKFNVRADLENIMFLIVVPKKLPFPMDILDGLVKFRQSGREVAQDRSDAQLMKAFVEPSTPYRVEIGAEDSERAEQSDRGTVEVVIPGRRRSDAEPEPERHEFKLIGALEQCGPDRERDPVTLACRPHQISTQIVPEKSPEVTAASS